MSTPDANICDCELGHNGIGLSGRECDCPAGARPIHDGWQPIETAPKDGTKFLGWNKTAGVHSCKIPSFTAHYKIPEAAKTGGGWFRPTHWQPLPRPPVEAGG